MPVIVWVPVPTTVGVYVTWHVAVAAIVPAARVQLVPGKLKVPVPLLVKLTEPPGVVAPDVEISVTVPVQVVTVPTTTDPGEQLTLVVVGCGGSGGMLPVCVVSESATPALARVTHRGGWLEVPHRVVLETKLMVEVVAGTAVKLYFTRKRRPVVGATVMPPSETRLR